MQNYAMRVGALQIRLLTDPLYVLDMCLAAHAGLSEPIPYEWLPLLDRNEKEQAEALKMHTQAVTEAYKGGLVMVDEARDRLSKNKTWGELGDYTEELLGPPEPDPPEPMPGDGPGGNSGGG